MGIFRLIEQAREEDGSSVEDGEAAVEFAICGIVFERLDNTQQGSRKSPTLRRVDTFCSHSKAFGGILYFCTCSESSLIRVGKKASKSERLAF